MKTWYASYLETTGQIISFREVGDVYPTPTPTPFITITAEQHTDFFTRGQRHQVINGEFVYVEPLAPTAEEIKQHQLSALDAEYQPQFQEMQLAWTAANLDGNTSLAAELQTDYAALKSEYNEKREAIVSGS